MLMASITSMRRLAGSADRRTMATTPPFARRTSAGSMARVWRLCSQQRLWSLRAEKRGLDRKARPPVHDDRVR